MIFTAGFLLMAFTYATAQMEIKHEEKYVFPNSPQLFNIPGTNLPSKATNKQLIPLNVKLPDKNTHNVYADMTKNLSYFKAIDKSDDESGINFRIAERTSLNLDFVGCYDGLTNPANNTIAGDTCDQSPDLDMSLTFVFDLK